LYVIPWTTDFYVDAGGHAPVEEFLDGLPKKHRAKLLGLIAKLMEHGPALPVFLANRGQAAGVKDALWEDTAAPFVFRGRESEICPAAWSGQRHGKAPKIGL
jgi:hypothetical protein